MTDEDDLIHLHNATIDKIRNGKKLSDWDAEELMQFASEKKIRKHGITFCRNKINNLYDGMDEYKKDEDGNYPSDPNGITSEHLRAAMSSEGRKREDEQIKAWEKRSEEFTKAIIELAVSKNKEGAILLEILGEAGIDLQKKVFKVMKHYLHPDKSTGNEGLFIKLKDVEGYFSK